MKSTVSPLYNQLFLITKSKMTKPIRHGQLQTCTWGWSLLLKPTPGMVEIATCHEKHLYSNMWWIIKSQSTSLIFYLRMTWIWFIYTNIKNIYIFLYTDSNDPKVLPSRPKMWRMSPPVLNRSSRERLSWWFGTCHRFPTGTVRWACADLVYMGSSTTKIWSKCQTNYSKVKRMEHRTYVTGRNSISKSQKRHLAKEPQKWPCILKFKQKPHTMKTYSIFNHHLRDSGNITSIQSERGTPPATGHQRDLPNCRCWCRSSHGEIWSKGSFKCWWKKPMVPLWNLWNLWTWSSFGDVPDIDLCHSMTSIIWYSADFWITSLPFCLWLPLRSKCSCSWAAKRWHAMPCHAVHLES